MGYLWIVSFALCGILIAASQRGTDTGVGYAPDVGQIAIQPIAVAAMLLVFAYYYFRFSEWPHQVAPHLRQRPPRYYTTAARYHLSASIYGLMMMVAFLGLYLFPEAISEFIGAFSQGLAQAESFGLGVSGDAASTALTVGGPASSESDTAASAALQSDALFSQLRGFLEQGSRDDNWLFTVLALIVVIWPKLPFSSDDRIRDALQRFAAIPTEARGLILRLSWNHKLFQPSAAVIYRLLGTTDLLGPNDFRAYPDQFVETVQSERLERLEPFKAQPRLSENPRRIGYQFAKLRYLTDRLLQDGIDPRNRMRLHPDSTQYEHIEQKVADIALQLRDLRGALVDLLSEQMPEKFADQFRDRAAALREPVQRLLDFADRFDADDPQMQRLQQQRREIKLQIDDTLESLYFHIVTTILASESSPENERLRFERFGFKMPKSWNPLQESNALATLVALVLIAALVPTIAYRVISGDLDPGALRMQCGDLIAASYLEALGWSLIAVTQNAIAVVAAFVLASANYLQDSVRPAIDERQSSGFDFGLFTRRVSAFLNGASIAFAVNLLLLTVLLKLTPQQGCGVNQIWIWAIPPGIAGGFAALYLTFPPRNFAVFQWPLWQGLITGLTASFIGLAVITGQSMAGGPGADFPFVVLMAAPVGLVLGRLIPFPGTTEALDEGAGHVADRIRPSQAPERSADAMPIHHRLILFGAIALALLGLVLCFSLITGQSVFSASWSSLGIHELGFLRGGIASEHIDKLAVFFVAFLCAFLAAVYFSYGYQLLLRDLARHDGRGRGSMSDDFSGEFYGRDNPTAFKYTPSEEAFPQRTSSKRSRDEASKKRLPKRRPLLWGGVAVTVGAAFGLLIHPIAGYGLGIFDGTSGSAVQAAELSFVVYCYAVASTVGLLCGFFVLKFKESGVPAGEGLETFMDDESLEVELTAKQGKQGRLVVMPVSAQRAMVLGIPDSFEVGEDTTVRLPDKEEWRVRFEASRAADAKEAMPGEIARSMSESSACSLIWLELIKP